MSGKRSVSRKRRKRIEQEALDSKLERRWER